MARCIAVVHWRETRQPSRKASDQDRQAPKVAVHRIRHDRWSAFLYFYFAGSRTHHFCLSFLVRTSARTSMRRTVTTARMPRVSSPPVTAAEANRSSCGRSTRAAGQRRLSTRTSHRRLSSRWRRRHLSERCKRCKNMENICSCCCYR